MSGLRKGEEAWMRVTGGAARGILLKVADAAGLRPATDRLRESVFSSLGDSVAGIDFVDLFAGSGAYGLEALSRGARGGVFVEKNRRVASILTGNLRDVCKSAQRDPGDFSVHIGDARSWEPGQKYFPGLVFVDPPYAEIPAVAGLLFEKFSAWRKGFPGLRVVFELPGEIELNPSGWRLRKRLGGGRGRPSVGIYEKSATVCSTAMM